MNESKVLKTTWNEVKKRYAEEHRRWRTKPRPPARLLWLAQAAVGQSPTVPKGHVFPDYAGEGTPPDVVARTFCAVEDFNTWMDRVRAGEARHQETLNLQAGAMLTRLQTAAAFRGGGKSPDDPPF